jgi:ribosome modulation factor
MNNILNARHSGLADGSKGRERDVAQWTTDAERKAYRAGYREGVRQAEARR